MNSPEILIEHSGLLKPTILGWLYEIGVKSALIESLSLIGYRAIEDSMDPRFSQSLDAIIRQALRVLNISSSYQANRFQLQATYTWSLGHLHGQRFFRALSKTEPPKRIKRHLKRFWIPFPEIPTVARDDRHCDDLKHALGLPQDLRLSLAKGRLPNADLLLEFESKTRCHRIAADISLNFSLVAGLGVTDGVEGRLLEGESLFQGIQAQAATQRNRSPFASVRLGGEDIAIPEDMARFHAMFCGREKSFFKICQAASYLLDWCEQAPPKHPDRLRCTAVAITPLGDESITSEGIVEDSVIAAFGKVYRECASLDSEAFQRARQTAIVSAYRRIRNRLPRTLLPRHIPDRPDPGDVRDFFGREVLINEPEEGLFAGSRTAITFPNPAMPLDHPVLAETAKKWRLSEGDFRLLHAHGVKQVLDGEEQLKVVWLLGHPGAGKT